MDEPIHPAQIEALKRMTPAQKLAAISQMWNLGRELMATGIRMRHPDWDESAVWEEVRRRLIYGPDYGPE
jgi:hypothetical protein